jgi:hypothetical protein
MNYIVQQNSKENNGYFSIRLFKTKKEAFKVAKQDKESKVFISNCWVDNNFIK